MTMRQKTYAASTDAGARSSAELEREVRQSRAEVEETLDAIQDRLSPGQMADQVTQFVRENGGEFARNFGQMVKQNPVPVMLVGVGLAWMMFGSRRDAGLPRAADLFDDDDELGYDPDYGSETWAAYEPGSATGWSAEGEDEGGTSAASRRAREGLSEAGERVRAGFEQAGEAGQRARAGVGRFAHGARARAAGMRAGVAQRARRTGARARQYGERARDGWAEALHEHPLVLGTVGFAIGAAIAAALPPSRREDELIGASSDELKRRARAAGREGYAKAEAAAGAAYSAAQHEAKEQGLSREGVESAAEAVRHKIENVAEAATDAAKQEAGFRDRGDGEPTP